MSNNESWRGKVGGLTPQERDEFLKGSWIARLACLKEDGAPYVVPMWYQWDGTSLWVIPRMKSDWARYMANDPRVSIVIDEPGPPYRKVLVEGKAELVEEPNVGGKWVGIAEDMSYRYLGENGPKYLEATLKEPRWLFRIQPEKLKTWSGVDWAKRYKTAGEAQ